MYTVEVYAKHNGNVVRSRSGFKTVETAMDWGEKIANNIIGTKYRVFPADRTPSEGSDKLSSNPRDQ